MTTRHDDELRTASQLASLCVARCASAHAQAIRPSRCKIIVPFTAGSATDILARTVGQKLSELWGQPVVVENRPGAGGTIGAGVVAKSPPDGYTLMVHSAAHAVQRRRSIRTCPTTPLKDFVEVAPLGGQPNVLVVAPSAAIKTVADLVAAAKKKPGTLNFASAGTGSGTHINAEKFKLAAGIDVVHIPYKGTPEALTDTMAGRVDVLLLADLGGAAADTRRQAGGARRQHGASARACCRTCRRSPRPACRASTTTCGSACSRRRACRPTSSTRSTADVNGPARAGRARSGWRRSAPSRCR